MNKFAGCFKCQSSRHAGDIQNISPGNNAQYVVILSINYQSIVVSPMNPWLSQNNFERSKIHYVLPLSVIKIHTVSDKICSVN